ncbi:MAG TPA: carboxypeptidase regulatory-like domain-containing protein, partial [Sporichthya sp.]|nr:carboxypeptidase regulatory-like domain-containing protein [Sporichthya sp.]
RGFAPAERTDIALLSGEALNQIELRLGRGGLQLSGTVSDAGGGPIAGAAIRALALGAGGRPDGARTFLATSDGAGRYELRLARGAYRIVADAGGYAPARVDVHLSGDQVRDFRLTPAAGIRGHVVERGAGPVRGATVRLRSDAFKGGELRATTSDAEGAFAFPNLAGGNYWLSAQAGALVGRTPQRVTVASGAASADIVIEVRRGLAIAGAVVDATGAAVARARVRAGRDSSATTAADGTFRLEGLAPGRVTVTADSERHGPGRADVVLEQDDREGLAIKLSAESRVSGRVVDRDGRPLADASVTALVVKADAGGESVVSSAVGRSGPDGRFRLGGLGAGDLRIEAQHPGAGRGVAGPIPLPVGEERELEVRIGHGGMIRGVVHWEDGAPAGGVVAGGRQGSRPGISTMTDSQGRYEIGPFTAGDVTVWTHPEIDPIGEGLSRQKISLAQNEDKGGVDLVLSRHDEEIAGVVLGPDGRPLAGATVGASADYNGVSWRPYNKYARDEGGNYTVISGADGGFTVGHLPKGTFTVWATQPGLPEADAFRVAVGTRGVKVQFAEGGVLAGLAVDDKGAPIATYTVYAMLSAKNDATPELRAARGYVQDTHGVQDRSGAFEVSGLHSAIYDRLLTTPDRRGARLQGIALRAGEAKRDLRIVLSDVVRVKGRVVEASSEQPLAGVNVTGWLAMLMEQVSGRSDSSGTFVLEKVVPGPMTLSLRGSAQSGLKRFVEIDVPRGGTEYDAGTFVLGAASSRAAE